MNIKLETALNTVEASYSELIEISNNILNPILAPANSLVEEITTNINNLTVDQLRDFILRLQLKAFEISEVKEKAAMKAELAEVLQKEAFAIKFNSLDGSAAVKDKLATVEISSEIVSETLYNLIANLLKTKLDQLHRLVDAMKSILMSRMQETKFMSIGVTNDVRSSYGSTTQGIE